MKNDAIYKVAKNILQQKETKPMQKKASADEIYKQAKRNLGRGDDLPLVKKASKETIYKLAKANLTKHAAPAKLGVFDSLLRRIITKPSGQRVVRPVFKKVFAPVQKEVKATARVNALEQELQQTRRRGLSNAIMAGGIGVGGGIVAGMALNKKNQVPEYQYPQA